MEILGPKNEMLAVDQGLGMNKFTTVDLCPSDEITGSRERTSSMTSSKIVVQDRIGRRVVRKMKDYLIVS